MITISVKSSQLATLPWLEKVEHAITSLSELGSSSPAIKLIKRQISALKVYEEEPIQVSLVISNLVSHGIEESDIAIVKSVPVPRKVVIKKPNPMDWYGTLEKVGGKSLVLINWPEYTNMDHKEAMLVSRSMKKTIKAIKGLSQYRYAHSLWESEVRKLKLNWIRGRSTEEASWDIGGVLSIVLGNYNSTVDAHRRTIVHELGHALEEKLGIIVSKHDQTPYGNPPFITEYAKLNPSEDFAETFLAHETQPRILKSRTPEKYDDIKRRLLATIK